MSTLFLQPKRSLAAAVLAVGLTGAGAYAQVTDISQMPLASASNLSVLPNIMFVLDDSGSMMFDYMPDHTEGQQGASEKRYFHERWQCKPKGVLTGDPGDDAKYGSVGGRPATHCDRIDPPFGASEFNGVYYNPQINYRPPLKADGTSFAKMGSGSWSKVPCDPYPTEWDCKEWNFDQDYYQGGYGEVDLNADNDPEQTYSAPDVKEWYGTNKELDLTTLFPEVVYCTASGTNTGDLAQCRRNGLPTSGTGSDVRHTGNPFRYSVGGWRTGYPEAPPVHEFFRPSSGSTVTVLLGFKHGKTSGTFKIIPRTNTGITGSGLDSCTGTTCTTTFTATFVSTPGGNQITYNSTRSGTRIAYADLDVVLTLSRTTNLVTATWPFPHGYNTGDTVSLQMYNVTGSFSTTGAVTANVLNATQMRYTHTGANGTGEGFMRRMNLFNIPRIRRGAPFYYTIEATEYCADAALTTCTETATPGVAPAGFPYAAPVRYCRTQFDANRLDTPSGNLPNTTTVRCRKKFEEDVASERGYAAPRSGYVFVRYGQFRRVDISTAVATYGSRALRYDCAARPNCTYAEEMTNFANWFAYYRTRMLMMKTASGIAFSPINDRYRVGFVTINPGNPVSTSEYLRVDKFTPTHKTAWYDKFYNQVPNGGTPLTEALSRVGRHFAGKKDGINKGMNDDPVEYSCQQNFALLTTDGYWSGRNGDDVNGNTINNVDHVLSTKNPRGLWDGATDGGTQDPDGGASAFSGVGNLSDIALYYYQTDLRGTGATGTLGTDVSENNVPTREEPITRQPSANWQHMVTFGLGMAEGLMDWRSDYESIDATGDFDNIRDGASGCAWASGTCNWPVPGDRQPANLDDLWHAAVNGRGKFFYARDTQAVQDGLFGALTSLQERNASGAAAATSTPNITPTDRAIFTTTYTTVQWNGDVIAQLIDPNTGSVLAGVSWSARDQLQNRVGTTTDSRTIYLHDSTQSNGLKAFQYAGLTVTEKTWFDNKCTPLSNLTQCSTLEPTIELPLAQSGLNMVNFLRGHTLMEGNAIYRDRRFALGDTVNAVPLYIAKPRMNFADSVPLLYSTWKEQDAIKNRTPTVYVAANDGMLHAFNANTGEEQWAYIPRTVAPSMWRLAEQQYATKHQYFVDGSPVSMDVWDGSTWRTMMVGGLNSGGRGFYALDVTDPASPRALWEFCNEPTQCAVSDKDLGLSYGNPVITKRPSDNKWVVMVTSGYNNVVTNSLSQTGDGQGYLYVLDALTGSVLQKIGTGTGSTATPSGLGRISAWAENYTVDNKATFVYGGDLLGNIWKFDLTTSTPVVLRLGEAKDASGKPQPITTKPELGLIDNVHKVVFVGTGRYLGMTDLTDPGASSPTAWQQSIYAFKDRDMSLGNLRSGGAGLVQQTLVNSSATERTIVSNAVNWGSQNGWFMDLNPGNTSPGERVNVDPQLALGTLIITANVPGGGACAIGGDSWTYQFDYLDGSFVFGSPNGRVGVKQTGALSVGMVVYQLQKGSLVGQLQRSNTDKLKTDILTGPGVSPHRRTNWRDLSPTR